MKKKTRQGFTMVELSLAMIFIGILSLALAFIVTSTLASYRRGLTLNQVNEIGQAIVDDVRAAVQNSSGKSVMALCYDYYENDVSSRNDCLGDGARSFIHLEKKASVKVGSGTPEELPVYGILCTGTYTYLWASGYFDSRSNATVYNVTHPSYSGNNTYRLLKVSDSNRAICKSIARKCNSLFGSCASAQEGSHNDYENASNFLDSDTYNNLQISVDSNYGSVDNVSELLNTKYGVADLALYTFDINNPAESETEGNAFYSGSFILGTIDGGMNITEKGRTCDPPSNYSGNFDYCAINKFSFAAQTNGAKF